MSTYQARNARRARTHTVRGIDYRVHEWGQAGSPLLVLLHGWGDSGASFQFLVDELEHAWFVIAPDWRGFGDSGWNAEAYWFPDYLADLDALLTIYSPDSAARLVGHSMGANVASLYAGVLPERVAALVNIEGFGLADSDPDGAPDNYRQFVEGARQRGQHPGYADIAELEARIRKLGTHIGAAEAAYVAALWSRRDSKGRVVLKADPAHRWPNAVQYRRQEAIACWRRVMAPALIVTGAETHFSAANLPWLHEDQALPFPRATRATVPGAGHMVHFEQPARLAAEIESFLDTVAADPAALVNPSSTG